MAYLSGLQSQPQPHDGLDTRAWMIWVTAAAVVTMAGRNPLYTLALLMVALVVWQNHRAGMQLPLLRLGVIILLFSTLFNLFWVHLGTTVLFRLPSGWPLIGGIITLEAAVYGLSNGLLLLTLLTFFQTFSGAVSSGDLVRLMPGALRDLGVVMLIALTYVPETRRHFERIQLAQAIRGHRLRGWRDWRPVALPLLIGGLERAMSIAESMVARGYGATADSPQRNVVKVGLLVGITAVLAGWLLILWQHVWGWALIVGGGIGIMLLFWQMGRRSPRTRYQTRPWQWADSLVAGTAVISLLLLLLPAHIRQTMEYTPFPTLNPPPFHPLAGLGILLLAMPAFYTTNGKNQAFDMADE